MHRRMRSLVKTHTSLQSRRRHIVKGPPRGSDFARGSLRRRHIIKSPPREADILAAAVMRCPSLLAVALKAEHLRVSNWPVCGQCAARLYLHGPPAVPSTPSANKPSVPGASSASMTATVVPPSAQESIASALDALTRLYSSGYLTGDEFKAAKQRILS